eukprot:3335276-Alexandrium_andersonii.AAC.1
MSRGADISSIAVYVHSLVKHGKQPCQVHLFVRAMAKRPLGMTIGHVNTNHEIGQSMSRIGYDTRN